MRGNSISTNEMQKCDLSLLPGSVGEQPLLSMTDFMTAQAFILIRLRSGEQRPRGDHFQLSCDHCRERHKTEVWLCFLILSLLSTSTCAAATSKSAGLQLCLKKLKQTIEERKSDALLYAPSIDDITENCKIMSLNCYILELIVILCEEDISQSKEADCIYHFQDTLGDPSQPPSVGCPPCEAHTVQNVTIFLERLRILLQSMHDLY